MEEGGEPGKHEESVEIAKRLLDAYNAYDADGLVRLMSETSWVDSPEGPLGPYGFKAMASKHFVSFPDSAWSKTRVSTVPSGFILEVVWTATPRIPIANERLSVPIRFTGHVSRGKIEKLHIDYAADGSEKQLGLGTPQGK